MKERIKTSGSAARIGPYSQAIAVEGFLFCAGQVAHRPGDRAASSTAASSAQTERSRCGTSAPSSRPPGSPIDDVVKTTCYLADMDDFGAFNEVYAHLLRRRPARLARPSRWPRLPLDIRVEIEAVAVRS